MNVNNLNNPASTLYLQFDADPKKVEAAAITLQKVCRGWRCRKEYRASLHRLPETHLLRTKVNTFLRETDMTKERRGNTFGKTAVFFPKEFPTLILKRSGYGSCERFQKMIQARNICAEIKSTSLVVPKAFFNKLELKDSFLKGDYLVEERLPLGSISRFDQQKLYLEHLDELTPVIREMAHFVLKSGLGDLIQIKGRSFPREFNWNTRYDNIPFFFEDNKIKIGLIDLEHMNMKQQKPSIESLQSLVYLYPYHGDVIFGVGRAYFEEKELKLVEESVEQGKSFIKVSCENIRQYIKEQSLIAVPEKIRVKIVNEFKEQFHLDKDQCKILDETLIGLANLLNEIKENKTDAPIYHFNSGLFTHGCDEAYWSLESHIHRWHRETLNGESPLKGKDSLLELFLEKFEENKIIYSFSLVGFCGIIVD